MTTLKPDIVLLDETKKEAFIFELTCPFEQNIHKRHKQKADKYAHFETDIKSYHTWQPKHTYPHTKISRQTHQKENIHKHFMSTLPSYYIFTARKHTSWEHTDYINQPFLTNTQKTHNHNVTSWRVESVPRPALDWSSLIHSFEKLHLVCLYFLITNKHEKYLWVATAWMHIVISADLLDFKIL